MRCAGSTISALAATMRPRRALLLSASLWLLGVAAPGAARALESLDTFPTSSVEITTHEGPQRFHIWIADNTSRSEQGLMFVRSLGKDQGMLFPRMFNGPMSMWMKNTLIPLDMLFVDQQGEIIFIQHSAKPESETIIKVPDLIVTPAVAVLELAGGECAKRHIEQGDHLSLQKVQGN
jgi:uncharacterized membrane protein (UPF0127 family)